MTSFLCLPKELQMTIECVVLIHDNKSQSCICRNILIHLLKWYSSRSTILQTHNRGDHFQMFIDSLQPTHYSLKARIIWDSWSLRLGDACSQDGKSVWRALAIVILLICDGSLWKLSSLGQIIKALIEDKDKSWRARCRGSHAHMAQWLFWVETVLVKAQILIQKQDNHIHVDTKQSLLSQDATPDCSYVT